MSRARVYRSRSFQIGVYLQIEAHLCERETRLSAAQLIIADGEIFLLLLGRAVTYTVQQLL